MTAQIVQKKIIETSMIKQFEVTVKAEEISNNSRSTVAKLKITVKPVDSNPPKLRASATQGYVDENSEIDTIVVDEMKAPIMLTVTDDDFVSFLSEYINGLCVHDCQFNLYMSRLFVCSINSYLATIKGSLLIPFFKKFKSLLFTGNRWPETELCFWNNNKFIPYWHQWLLSSQ